MTTLGAIRWDCWYDNSASMRSTLRSLGNPDYMDRAPAHATVLGNGLIRFDATEATMSQEIALAASANIYWAFLCYNRPINLMNGFDLFQANPNKLAIDWCMIRQSYGFGTTGNYSSQITEMVGLMQQSNYKKVLGARPLLYLFYTAADLTANWGGSLANFKVALDALRASAQAAGLGNPYIVLMTTPQLAPALASGLGTDALSAYIAPSNPHRGANYTDLDAATKVHWSSQTATGLKTVPTAMLGWHRAPRIARPVAWEPQLPWDGIDNIYTLPTNAQIVTHLSDAKNYATINSVNCEADTVLAYAWNEFDEGGWIAATIGDPSGSRATAIAAANLFTR